MTLLVNELVSPWTDASGRRSADGLELERSASKYVGQLSEWQLSKWQLSK